MNKLHIGTWNVRTLLQPGKMQELAAELEKTTLEIVAIQETRWSKNGIINKKVYALFYSGSENQIGQAGTGFLVKKGTLQYIIDFSPINERICSLRVKGKYNNITLINAYAPTEEKDILMKEQFYDNLQKTFEKVAKSDTIITLGDFNTQVGIERAFCKVTGKHTLHEDTNENGQMLCDFAIVNNLIIMSTQFMHKRIHKGTWISPDQTTLNQIDHVLINFNKKDMIEDVRSMRGPNIDSDHFLLSVRIKQKLPFTYRNKSRQITKIVKWNKNNIQNPLKLKQYKKSIHDKLELIPDNQSINEEWESIKSTILDVANEVIQKQEKPTRNQWRKLSKIRTLQGK